MQDGFIKTAAATPDIQVADCDYNAQQIARVMRQAAEQRVKLLVLPELCVTGYTCGDLFLQPTLLQGAEEALRCLLDVSRDMELLTVLGVPLRVEGKLFNCGAVLYCGELLGVVPKCNLPNHGEFYERRHFTPGTPQPRPVSILGKTVPFGGNLLFQWAEEENFCLAVELCEDLWVPQSPSLAHTAAGATIVANPSASSEAVGKSAYRRDLVTVHSGQLVAGYVYASAGEGESTTDLIFSGHNLIAENGKLLAESPLFSNGMIVTELDVDRLEGERRKMTTYPVGNREGYQVIPFSMGREETPLTRFFSPSPFVPEAEAPRAERCEAVLTMQSLGLKKRVSHTSADSLVLGISGGLDSTLALLVSVRAMDALSRNRKDILAVTMPCFGTSNRTRQNALRLCEALGVTLREIDITQSVLRHFEDIGQDPQTYDVTFENAQARERTQVLMDLANQANGLVVGTGDLSELALGWATYNGDHMSMYGVNASVPKTLVRHLVAYTADQTSDPSLRETLLSILDTPVSPELLPADAEEITQKTEELVGPYPLHDFFLYYMVRFAFPPGKILRLAELAFAGEYDRGVILSWMKVFYRRFFSQQFKRSCLPDAPKVGSVSLSPRGDWRMPSDACRALWEKELSALEG